jgi:hypothetical protein
LSSWRRRASVDASVLDRRVSEVRVVDPYHPLYGNWYPASDRRSGRGLGLIVVHLPDGRERAIPRSATNFAVGLEDPRTNASQRAHISVRTLLPLANHVGAVLASRNADLKGSAGRDPDPAQPRQGSVLAAEPMAAASAREQTPARAARGTTGATSAATIHPVGGKSSC